VDITYTVPAGTATGTTDLLILKASSVNDTFIHDTAEVSIYATTTPNPLSISTALLTFGTQAMGGTSKTSSVIVTNTGTAEVTFSGISTTAEFSETNSCGTTLALGASCSISISFTPAAPGVRTGTLTISGSGLSAPLTAGLQGNAVVVNNLPRPVIGLTVAPTAPVVGQAVSIVANVAGATGAPVPTGNVTFTSGTDGTTTLGQATVDGSGNATLNLTSLSAGTYTVFAQYPGDAAYHLGSSPVAQFTVSSTVPTVTTLGVSGTTVQVGSVLTLSATVTSASGVPVGSVNLLDGANLLGTATLDSSGIGTFSISTLALGAHTLTAEYAGSGIFTTSVSSAVQETIVAVPGYSVSATPTSLTITRGQTGTASIAITPLNGYAGTITLSCGALPAEATCSFSPAQIVFTALSQSSQATTLTIGTKQVALLAPETKPGIPGRLASALAVALWLPSSLLGVFTLRRKVPTGTRTGLYIGVIILGLFSLVSLNACGGHSKLTTPAGTYTVPITITDGTLNNSISYTVVVQ
jgi:hypothetical protein